MLTSLRLSESQRASLQTAAERYHESINSQLASYLLARGIDKDAARGELLGLVAEPVPGHEQFTGMLSIPYVTPAGVVAIKFRCVQDHDCKDFSHPKYNAPSGQKPRLYGVRNLFTDQTHIAICEGELDAVVMTHAAGIPAVGVAGGDAWQDHMPRCFADFEKVFIVMDHDVKEDGSNPGARFARRIAESLDGGVVIRPPAGLDVTEWQLRDGADAIREKVLGE